MRREYPRPGLRRAGWLCLNGEWDLWATGKTAGRIQVPYLPGTPASGVAEMAPTRLGYGRVFVVPKEWRGKHVLLHFGAVNGAVEAKVNGSLVCAHVGGDTDFAADITDWVTFGRNTLQVEVSGAKAAKGSTLGIWQTVWLEAVSARHIKALRLTPAVPSGEAFFEYELSETGGQCELELVYTVKDKELGRLRVPCLAAEGSGVLPVLHAAADAGVACEDVLWTPDAPNLVEVKATLWDGTGEQLDEVECYFGMRQIHIEDGRICLNGKPCYQRLVLDEGCWPESGPTAPEDKDYAEAILSAKAMGFNGCRRGREVIDPRFLYWADRLGFLVWGGVPASGAYSAASAARMVDAWRQVMLRDHNHPSIVAWDLLQESVGAGEIYEDARQQALAKALYHMAYALDGTRLVISNDGWEHTEPTDLLAVHSYAHGGAGEKERLSGFAAALKTMEGLQGIVLRPLMVKGAQYGGQPVILSEFGGIEGEGEALLMAYGRLAEAVAASPLLQGFCYASLADGMGQGFGLLRADRSPKVAPELIGKINRTVG